MLGNLPDLFTLPNINIMDINGFSGCLYKAVEPVLAVRAVSKRV